MTFCLYYTHTHKLLHGRSQRELSQTRCDFCSFQLRQPYRMLGCRHVVCRLCAESTVLYEWLLRRQVVGSVASPRAVWRVDDIKPDWQGWVVYNE